MDHFMITEVLSLIISNINTDAKYFITHKNTNPHVVHSKPPGCLKIKRLQLLTFTLEKMKNSYYLLT